MLRVAPGAGLSARFQSASLITDCALWLRIGPDKSQAWNKSAMRLAWVALDDINAQPPGLDPGSTSPGQALVHDYVAVPEYVA